MQFLSSGMALPTGASLSCFVGWLVGLFLKIAQHRHFRSRRVLYCRKYFWALQKLLENPRNFYKTVETSIRFQKLLEALLMIVQLCSYPVQLHSFYPVQPNVCTLLSTVHIRVSKNYIFFTLKPWELICAVDIYH